ncbi:serine/threonine protein kinase [Longimicrobium sp.]|jgi:serine/threonine-protein kinase|uniref:serine/threonine protein kinase n=1 Tax=Longimicrobium sp. TaxID=2029185 RepID=UPI002ED91E6A
MDKIFTGTLLAGRYEVMGQAGRGAGGSAYRALDRSGGGEVTLKLLPQAEGDERERLLSAARAAAGVRHPNLPAVLDVVHDAAAGVDALVLPPMKGEDLGRCVQLRELPLADGLAVLAAAARAVGAAHRAGLVHGWVRPSAVFLLEGAAGSEAVRVMDLGVGPPMRPEWRTAPRFSRHAGVMEFAAPEQWRGEEPTPATDVFSLAMTGVFALTRQAPYAPDEVKRMAGEQADVPAALPTGWPAPVAALFRRALLPDPGQRFGDGDEFGDAVDAVRAAEASDEPAAARAEQVQSPPAHRGRAVPAGAWAILLLAAGCALWLWTASRSSAPRTPDPAPPPAAAVDERVDSVDPPLSAASADRPADARDLAAPGGKADTADASHTYELSEVVEPPRVRNMVALLRELERSYPPGLRDAGVTGVVLVRFRIMESGAVDASSMTITEASHPAFVEPTILSIQKLRFDPARVNGRPVKVWAELPVQWQLAQ